MNKSIVWALFFVLTAMQAMGNTFYAFTHLDGFQDWVDLFGLGDFEVIAQKRILSIVSGAVLPLVALGFIKSLVDYIKPNSEVNVSTKRDGVSELVIEQPNHVFVETKQDYDNTNISPKEREETGETYDEPAALADSGIIEREEVKGNEPEIVPKPVVDQTQIEKNKLLDQIKVFK